MDIDWTIVAFEALNFGILVILMRRFLFRPVQRALVARREQIEKIRLEVEQREAAAEQQRLSFETRERELEDARERRLEQAAEAGREQAASLVQEGREQARAMVGAAERQIDVARRRALEQLRTDVLALARDAATRVVRHMEAPAVASAYARRAAHGLAELVGDATPEAIAVATGEDVDPDEIELALRSVLGAEPRLTIEVDPSIVAGVRLRAQGHEVEASVSESLHHWYQQQIEAEGGSPEAAA